MALAISPVCERMLASAHPGSRKWSLGIPTNQYFLNHSWPFNHRSFPSDRSEAMGNGASEKSEALG